MLTIAPYCHEESHRAGATPAQIKAGIALVEQAMVSLEGINAQKIEVTIAEGFHPWWRLKAPKKPFEKSDDAVNWRNEA